MTTQRTESTTVTPARQYYRVKDAARVLGVPPRTLYHLVEHEQIPCRRLGTVNPPPGVVGRARADHAGKAALMSVTRRALATGNVSWRAKVFFEGRVIAQRSFGRQVDAKRWEADQLAKLDAGTWIDPARGRMTFAALAEERQASRGHLAVRSHETTRFLLDKYVIPEIGSYPIYGIAATDVERVMSALTARGLATATRRRARSMMRLSAEPSATAPGCNTRRMSERLRPSETGRGISWLRNFPEYDRDDAARLIDSLQVYGRATVGAALIDLLSSLLKEGAITAPALVLPVLDVRDIAKHDTSAQERRPAAYDTFDPGSPVVWTRGSETFIGATLRAIVGEKVGEEQPGWLHPSATLGELRQAKARSIVVCTDYCGTGAQTKRFVEALMRNSTLRSWRSYGWIDVHVATFAGSRPALTAVRSHPRVDVVSSAVTAASFDDAPWDRAQRERIVRLCKRYGSPGPRRSRALGFGGSAGLFATDVQIPNNVPSILRRTDPGWNPFFDGFTMPRDLAEAISGYVPRPDYPTIAREARELRLADALSFGRRPTSAQRILVLLALLRAGSHERTELASLLGLETLEVQRDLDALQAAGFVDSSYSLTERGMSELAAARRRRRVVTAGLSGNEHPYYPSQLR